MTEINLSSQGPPETVLDPEPDGCDELVRRALEADPENRRDAVAEIVAKHPRCLVAWSTLGDLARDPVEAYACYRVGYHRGLDRLRGSGWRGSGYVRWRHPTNVGFLRALDGLRRTAAQIGELDEADRCRQFLAQLDPTEPPE